MNALWSQEVDLILRQADARDLPGICDCLESLAPVGLDLAAARQVFQEYLRDHARLYVAEMPNAEIVGTATLHLDRKFIHSGGLVGRIEDVAAKHAWMGRGVGSALVRHLAAEAKAAGAYKVILNCMEPLVDWYERNGFRRYDVGMRMDLQ